MYIVCYKKDIYHPRNCRRRRTFCDSSRCDLGAQISRPADQMKETKSLKSNAFF